MLKGHRPSMVRCALSSILGLIAFEGGAPGGSAVVISEIRIDQPATDNDEYLELRGAPGTSLAGLSYLVIGDGSGLSGTIEAAISLSGLSIGPSGYFVVAEPTFTLGTADLVVSVPTEMNFENDDNVTHLLVEGFSGAPGDDLDSDNDGILDVHPWSAVLDLIAAIRQENPPTTTEFHYGPPALGPVGSGAPWHVYRRSGCDDWIIGGGDAGSDDTVGAANPSCPPPPVEYYFGLAHSKLGGAITQQDIDGSLLISNIGSSGQDGVSIDLFDGAVGALGPGVGMDIDFGQAGALAAGAIINFTLSDSTSDPVNVVLQWREINGGAAGLSIQRAVCDPCELSVELLNNGAVVGSAILLPPYPPDVVTGNIGSQGEDDLSFTARVRHANDDSIDEQAVFAMPEAVALSLMGSPPVDANAVRVSLNGLPPGTRYIGNLVLTGGNTGPIDVSSEALIAHELTHVVQQSSGGAVNNAHIIGGGDLDGDGSADVVVSNIGSSGNDGVSLRRGISFPAVVYGGEGADEISVEADWGPAGALPSGSAVHFEVDATGPAIRTYALAVSETKGGQGAVSFIPCNEPGCCEPCCPCAGITVEALHHGLIVDQVVHDVLPPSIAISNIGSSGQDGVEFSAFELRGCDATGNLVLGVRNPLEGPMTLTGSAIGPVTANELRVKVKFPTLPGDEGTYWARLNAANVTGGEFAILGGGSNPAFHNDLTHFGLPHDGLGGAGIAINEEGIQISNIGSSGQDGVSIDLGEAQGWAAEVDFGPAGALPAGAAVKGKSRNLTDVIVFEVAETNGGKAAISFAQNVCNPCSTLVELFDSAGNTVTEVAMPPGFSDAIVTGAIGSGPEGNLRIVFDDADVLDDGTIGQSVVILNPVETTMTVSGFPPVTASAVRLSLHGLPPGERVIGTRLIDVTAEGIPDLVIASERVIQFSNQHAAQGQATICGSRDNFLQGAADVITALRIGNIGSSGQDGVEISASALLGRDDDGDGLSDLEGISVSFEPTTLPQASKLAIKTKGTSAQIVHEVELEIEADAGFDQVSADFTSIGSTTHTVEVYDNGTLVALQTGVGADVAQVASGARVNGGEVVLNPMSGGLVPGVMHKWFGLKRDKGPVAITLPGQKPVLGDQVRVTPENPTVQLGAISSMTVTGVDLGEFVILDETATPLPDAPACPPDLDGNGVVNVLDLLALIGNWGACDPGVACAGDIAPAPAGDGVVNVIDLLALIGSWGACAE